MILYFDASALAKRYVAESGSASLRTLLQSNRCATSRLSELEVISALARRFREGAFSKTELDRALSALKADLIGLIVVELAVEITVQAGKLLLRHQLRASDAIQLASCLHLQQELHEAVCLAAFDDRLNLAARAEGLKVL